MLVIVFLIEVNLRFHYMNYKLMFKIENNRDYSYLMSGSHKECFEKIEELLHLGSERYRFKVMPYEDS